MVHKVESFKLVLILALLLGFLATSTALMATDIIGRVTDSERGTNMPGANLQLQGTNYGSASDRFGNYRIYNVPPGVYTLVATYIGYEDFTVEINVVPGQGDVSQDISMVMSAVMMDAVVIEGQREGQMKALSQQRSASNIKNVVAQEQMERFPDINTAEVLQRVPGVFIDRSQGDGRYAFVRGTAPGMSAVTVNGEKLATNRTEERYSQLDIIAASQLASVEVVKAITPDMDGDAIGGSINLVTRSAFDYEGSRFSLTGGPGYNSIDGKLIGEARLNYSNRFGADKNIGFEFNANYDMQERGTDGMEFDFDDAEDINNNEIPFALDEFDLRNYRRTRTRYGFGTGLEYMLNKQHSWFGRFMYSRMDDEQIRNRWRIRVSKGDYLNPEGTLTEDSRLVTVHTFRTEELSQINYSFGGKHDFNGKKLDYTYGYSYANEEHPDQLEGEFELDEKVNLALDLDDPKFPKWELTNMDNAYQYEAANYELDGMDYRETYARNWKYMGSMNFEMPFGSHAVKAGFKFQRDKKNRDEDRWKLKWKGDDDVTLDQWALNDTDEKFMNDNYTFGPEADIDKMQDFYNDNVDGDLKKEVRWWDSEGQYYVNREDILAYYGMATFNVNKFRFLAGFRHELTSGKYKGTELFLDADGDFASLEQVTENRKYNNFLPMFHVRWGVTSMTNVRLAYTSTLARPDWFFVTPYLFVDPDGEELEQGDPKLDPTVSSNFDVMFEHYFQKVGVFAAGFFFKDMKDIIYLEESKVEGGVYDDFDLTMPINGGNGKLYGVELAWNQELSFLPGFMNGFGVYANYTHTWAKTDILGREDFLPGQSGDVANFSLFYDKYGFSIRLSAMYQGAYLMEIGKNKDWDEWRDEHWQLDLSAAANINPWLQFYFNAVNIANSSKYEYYGVARRPLLNELYGWWMKGGFKISL